MKEEGLPEPTPDFRKLAEEVLQKHRADLDAVAPEDVRDLLHELQVHQIELELQNEELRRTQQELDASREKYFGLYDMAPVGYVTMSQHGIVIEVNLAVTRMLGVRRDHLVRRPMDEFILGEDVDGYHQFRRSLFRPGEPNTLELRMLRRDRSLLWVRMEALVAKGSDGEPLCRATLSDITETKRAEEALRDSEELFRSLVHSSSDLTVLTDAEGVTTFVSPQCQRVTGFGAEAFLGLRMPDIIHPEDRALCTRAWEHVLVEGGEIHELEYRIIDSLGESRWVSHSATLMRVGERVLGVQNTIRDITERTQAEKEVMETLQQLQGARDALAQIEKQAAIGRLAAGVAHDILNPTTIISARLRFIEEEEASEQTRKSVKVCREQVQRITRICRDLIESARGRPRTHAHGDLRRAVDLGLEAVKNQIEEDRIQLEYEPPPESVPVGMELESLGRAMANLLQNACDAMASSQRKRLVVAIHRLEVPSRSPSVLVIVADSGRGIPEGAQGRIFEPFFTTKEKGIGLGLGLSIARGIVEEHGGRIRAENNEMGGASLIVELPLYQR